MNSMMIGLKTDLLFFSLDSRCTPWENAVRIQLEMSTGQPLSHPSLIDLFCQHGLSIELDLITGMTTRP